MALKTAVFVLISAFALIAQKPANKSDNSSGILVHTNNLTGVIFPAEKRALDWAAGNEKLQYWTPSESDVIEAEKRLMPFLQLVPPKTIGKDRILKNLKTYKRQYVGLVTKGQKEMFINFVCTKTETTNDNSWTRHVGWPYDGGPCYFRVYYSMTSQTFSRLMVNGYA